MRGIKATNLCLMICTCASLDLLLNLSKPLVIRSVGLRGPAASLDFGSNLSILLSFWLFCHFCCVRARYDSWVMDWYFWIWVSISSSFWWGRFPWGCAWWGDCRSTQQGKDPAGHCRRAAVHRLRSGWVWSKLLFAYRVGFYEAFL